MADGQLELALERALKAAPEPKRFDDDAAVVARVLRRWHGDDAAKVARIAAEMAAGERTMAEKTNKGPAVASRLSILSAKGFPQFCFVNTEVAAQRANVLVVDLGLPPIVRRNRKRSESNALCLVVVLTAGVVYLYAKRSEMPLEISQAGRHVSRVLRAVAHTFKSCDLPGLRQFRHPLIVPVDPWVMRANNSELGDKGFDPRTIVDVLERHSPLQHSLHILPTFFGCLGTIQRIEILFQIIVNGHSDRLTNSFEGVVERGTLGNDVQVQTMCDPFTGHPLRGRRQNPHVAVLAASHRLSPQYRKKGRPRRSFRREPPRKTWGIQPQRLNVRQRNLIPATQLYSDAIIIPTTCSWAATEVFRHGA